MEFTQKDMLEALEGSGRKNWNIRQMTQLRSEGFLPKLTPKRKSGTNKPLNVWDEKVIDQIVDVYDWWDYCDGDRVTLTLILWLQGYNIPLDPLHSFYIQTVEMYFQQLTRGETNPDEILQKVSEIVFVYMRKMRYTPGLANQRKKMEKEQNFSMKQMEMFIETMLSALVVPNQEFNAGEELEDVSTDYSDDEEFFVEFEDIEAILRDIFTLPHLIEAIRTATPEQWQQARTDYLSFCHILGMVEERRTSSEEASLPEALLVRLKITGAVWLITPLLSARYHGYGQYIDMAFEKMQEGLTDPAVQEQIINKHLARKTSEADVENIEKPELTFSE